MSDQKTLKAPQITGVRPGYHSVTPYIVIQNAAEAIAWYKKALGAEERLRVEVPERPGKIMHAEIQIGDSPLMLGDENAEMGYLGASSLGGSPVSMMIYTSDPDGMHSRAVAAGATSLGPVEEKEYGRSGGFRDPFGMMWFVSTHKEFKP